MESLFLDPVGTDLRDGEAPEGLVPVTADTQRRYALITQANNDHFGVETLKAVLDDRGYVIGPDSEATYIASRGLRVEKRGKARTRNSLRGLTWAGRDVGVLSFLFSPIFRHLSFHLSYLSARGANCWSTGSCRLDTMAAEVRAGRARVLAEERMSARQLCNDTACAGFD